MLQLESPRHQITRALLFFSIMVPALFTWWAGILPEPASNVLDKATDKSLNEVDVQLMTRGYYEELTDLDRGLWSRGAGFQTALRFFSTDEEGREEEKWKPIMQDEEAVNSLPGFLPAEFKPNIDVLHAGARLRTNRWGQRDRDYELQKPPGTFRIAIIGASNTMGKGVEVEQIYPEVLEDRLNEELGGSAYERYEVINFSMSRYHLLERVYVAEQKVPAFEPDLVLMVATRQDLRWAVHQHLAERIHEGRDLHFDYLRRIAERAGVKPGDSEAKLRQRLKRFRELLTLESFSELKTLSERLNTPIVVLNLRLMVNEVHEMMERQAVLAERAGLITLRIYDAYEGQKPEEIYIRSDDLHPSPKAHRRLADNVYDELLAHPQLRAMLLGERTAGVE